MKIFYTSVTSRSRIAAFVLLAFVGSMLVGTSALAAPPSPDNPATIYGPKSFVQSTISKISATPEGAASLKSGAIKVQDHGKGLFGGSRLEHDGKVLARGPEDITAQLGKWRAENQALNNNKPPEPDKEASGDQCIPVAPGQFEDGKTITGEGVTFKPNNSPTGYGTTADPDTMKIFEGPQDSGIFDVLPFPNVETPLNWKLRLAKMPALQEVVNKALEIKPQAAPGKPTPKVTVILPNAAQAQEFIASGGKSYTINKTKVTPGGKYTVNKAGTDGVVFDENCEPKQGPVPSVGPNGPDGPNPLGDFGEGDGGDFDGGGGGGGDDGGGLGGGGLAALLPLLMSLMGQQGNQNDQAQQQQAQNPLYNAQGQCAEQGVSPICGVDGKTYTNECYLQQMGITLAKKGVCDAPAASPTPAVTPDANAIATQLSQSGIPASLLASIQASIVSAITAALGGNVGETVIR